MAAPALKMLLGAAGATGGAAFSPTDIANLDIWFDPSDTATLTSAGSPAVVSQMNDKSGNGNHVTQSTNADRPQTGTATQNSLNILNHASADYLSKTGATHNVWTNRAMSLFIVTDHPNDASQRAHFTFQAITNEDHQHLVVEKLTSTSRFSVTLGDGANFGGAGDLITKTCPLSLPEATALWTILVSASGNSLSVRKNGVAQTLTTASGSMAYSSWLAATPGSWNVWFAARAHSSGNYAFTGKKGECLVYSSLLSGTDLSNVETYLINKWGL